MTRCVIPAEARIQFRATPLDSRLRRNEQTKMAKLCTQSDICMLMSPHSIISFYSWDTGVQVIFVLKKIVRWRHVFPLCHRSYKEPLYCHLKMSHYV